MNLTNGVFTKRVMPDASGYTVAAGQTDVTSSVIDTAGYEGVRFILGLGALTSTTVVSTKVRGGALSNGSDLADLEGTSVAVADDDDNQIVVIDVYRPQERYIALKTLRATANAVIDFLVVELYGARKEPVTTTHATVVATEMHVSPEEGTA